MNVPDAHGACWVDGRRVPMSEATVPVGDPAVLAGRGVFETLAVHSGRPVDEKAHLRRLGHGCLALGLDPPDESTLRATLAAAGAGVPARGGWIKIVVAGGRTFVFTGAVDPDEVGRPVRAIVLPWRRSLSDPLGGCKTLNYAANVLGQELARARGSDEGLWLNSRGHLAEGCTSNVFVIRRRRLFTPGSRDGILPGIVREQVLGVARDRGIMVHEGKVRLKRLETAAEAFLTSSVRGVRPLVAVDGKPVGTGEPGSLTLGLAEELARRRGVAEPVLDSEAQAPEIMGR